MYGIQCGREWVASIDTLYGRPTWTHDESLAMGWSSRDRAEELAEGIGAAKRLPAREVARRAVPVR